MHPYCKTIAFDTYLWSARSTNDIQEDFIRWIVHKRTQNPANAGYYNRMIASTYASLMDRSASGDWTHIVRLRNPGISKYRIDGLRAFPADIAALLHNKFGKSYGELLQQWLEELSNMLMDIGHMPGATTVSKNLIAEQHYATGDYDMYQPNW